MAVLFNREYIKDFFQHLDISSLEEKKKIAYSHVRNKDSLGNEFLGWTTLPLNSNQQELSHIRKAASDIQKKCDIFLVIGIGGSYIGARAAIDFTKSLLYNFKTKETPRIYFIGNNVSTDYISEIISLCDGHDICINVISKSGSTVEPAISFLTLLDYMRKRYGDDAYSRIYVTTDLKKSIMLDFANKHGCELFSVPSDIGGRYSVLSAVGLLPIAVSGCNIDAMLKGAEEACKQYYLSGTENNACLDFALYRNILHEQGRVIEIFAAYDPSVAMLCEWCRQLFGESEGKDGKGLFPASASFSTDLHSLGQYIQEGKRTMFETVIQIQKPTCDITIPSDLDVTGFEFLQGKNIEDINRAVFHSAAAAHMDAKVPTLLLEVECKNEENFGALVYFFELACAFSSYMLNVNPFNQPGVEAYKKYMRDYLKK